ncbi:uncharacterized protein LOC143556707 [Bidens hawaiensis]|uniref:uncharacterized protein LOC143556707 n=1 Tax=Bidens hawaiensis TaxID=980011 RepID=UPI00404B2993
MRRNRILDSTQAFSAHASLFCFTLLLVLKLDHLVSYSWWVVFFPLFLFHVIVAQRTSSSRGPFIFHGLYVAPRRVPFLIVFELLLYVFLQNSFLSLKIVFLPLLAFEAAIFYDNFRMCKGLLSEHDEISSDAICLALPHFWVAISMVFFGIGTVFTLKKLCGEPNSLDWWNLFIYFGIAECFVFLVCTKWCNPVIHSSIVRSTEDISENTMCGLQGTYGCFIKFLIICFQILLCMRLEGKPAAARLIPLPVVFSPVFLVQGLGVVCAAINLWEKIVILLYTRTDTVIYVGRAARPRDTLDSLQHGSRLGLRSTGSRGEQTRINCNESSRQV